MVFSTQEFFLFTQELIHFTQEILPLLPKKLRTSYSRNLRAPNHRNQSSNLANFFPYKIVYSLQYIKLLLQLEVDQGQAVICLVFTPSTGTENSRLAVPYGGTITAFHCLAADCKHTVAVVCPVANHLQLQAMFIGSATL